MPKTCPRNNGGVSLVEVMIALLVLGIGIVAVSSMHVANTYSAHRAKGMLADSLAAGRQLEEILALPFDDDRLSDRDRAYLPEQPDHGPFYIAGTTSTIEWEVDDDYPLIHVKRITVTVYRPDKGGGRKQMRYNYLKSRGYVP